jgi:hypothetical protein
MCLLKFYKNSRDESHFCLSFLNEITYEHQNIIACQLQRLNLNYCQFEFPKNCFSSIENLSLVEKNNISYTQKKTLIRHLKNSRSTAIFLQLPYAEYYPSWFNSISKKLNLAYAGYGISLSDYTEGQFNTELIRNSKYLLANSNYDFTGYNKIESDKAKIILTGNPMLYELRKHLSKISSEAQKKSMILLWAPHWSQRWLKEKRGFARWQVCIDPIFKFAKLNTNIKIIVRPHPILREAILGEQLGRTIFNRESLKSWNEDVSPRDKAKLMELFSLKNVLLSDNTLIQDVIESTHLITEGVSILAYWSATGKPMLLIRDDESPKFNVEGQQLTNKMLKAKSSDEISDWLNASMKPINLKVNLELQELNRHIYPDLEKSPIEIFLEFIKFNN